jgi:pyruvate-formate lyase
MAALESYADPRIDLLSDGAPADLNIGEDFPKERLLEAMRAFANGRGGNVLTLTVADPATFAAAERATSDETSDAYDPDAFNLVRVRMGGWSEYFNALFPAHQAQHRRRPFYTP